MATLLEIYELTGNGNLHNRLAAAIAAAAEDVRNEAAATTKHAERFAWAISVLSGEKAPLEEARRITWMVGQNPTVADGYAANSDGSTVTDSDIQFVVNSLVNFMAGVDTAS